MHTDDIPVMLLVMYLTSVLLYAYIVFRHFLDQKFKALTWLNPISHTVLISFFLGAFVTLCVLFSDRIFTENNARVFVPYFEHLYQMWVVVGLNCAALVWATIVAIC
jgi:hypothetical protein